MTGHDRDALTLFDDLLPDHIRVLGADHPATLSVRGNIAVWTGRIGNTRDALSLFEGLLPDLTRVLGPVHPDTLSAWDNIAECRRLIS